MVKEIGQIPFGPLWTLFGNSGGFYANKKDGPEGGSVIFFDKKDVADQYLATIPDKELYKVGKTHEGEGETGIVSILETAMKAGIMNFAYCHSVTSDPDSPHGGVIEKIVDYVEVRAIIASIEDGSHRHGG